jgi:DNA repair photolyase
MGLHLTPVPLHISNSTDPLQELLETERLHTLQLLERVAKNRGLFTTVTMLTKNPLLASQPEYARLLDALRPCQVEVSLAFADEEGRKLYEPSAPSVESRLEGIRRLRQANIPVSLRIDPLFPREPLPKEFWPRASLRDYGLVRTQTLDEIESLIRFASEVACHKIIVSPLKVPVGRWADVEFKEMFRALYGAPFGSGPKTRSFAWRLPEEYISTILIGQVEAIASQYGVPVVTCWNNLIGTP